MAYSKSIKTLEKRRQLLKDLELGRGCVWRTDNADRLAYQLREALSIARLYKERYPALAQAADNFRIEVLSPTSVQATPLQQTEASVLVDGGVVDQNPTPGKVSLNLMGPQTPESIIQTWHDVQPSNDPMVWPQANLDREALRTLEQWASKRTPPWLVIVDGGAVMLHPHTRTLESMAWRPATVPAKPLEEG